MGQYGLPRGNRAETERGRQGGLRGRQGGGRAAGRCRTVQGGGRMQQQAANALTWRHVSSVMTLFWPASAKQHQRSSSRNRPRSTKRHASTAMSVYTHSAAEKRCLSSTPARWCMQCSWEASNRPAPRRAGRTPAPPPPRPSPPGASCAGGIPGCSCDMVLGTCGTRSGRTR